MDSKTSSGTTLNRKLLLSLAILAGLAFVIVFAVPYMLLNPSKLERFTGREFWILSHVSMGTIALMVGPVQFWLGWRSKFVTHRRLGRIYLITIGLSSLSAFYLAITTDVSWVFGMGLGGLGVAWVLTTGFAFVAVRKRKIELHREWMTRSYIVTMGFVFFRFFLGVTTVFEIGNSIQRLEAASWFCWSFPLLVGEIFIQKKKLIG